MMMRVKNHQTPPTIRPDRELKKKQRDRIFDWSKVDVYIRHSLITCYVYLPFMNVDSMFHFYKPINQLNVNVVTAELFFFLANFANNQEQQSKNVVMFTPSK